MRISRLNFELCEKNIEKCKIGTMQILIKELVEIWLKNKEDVQGAVNLCKSRVNLSLSLDELNLLTERVRNIHKVYLRYWRKSKFTKAYFLNKNKSWLESEVDILLSITKSDEFNISKKSNSKNVEISERMVSVKSKSRIENGIKMNDSVTSTFIDSTESLSVPFNECLTTDYFAYDSFNGNEGLTSTPLPSSSITFSLFASDESQSSQGCAPTQPVIHTKRGRKTKNYSELAVDSKRRRKGELIRNYGSDELLYLDASRSIYYQKGNHDMKKILDVVVSFKDKPQELLSKIEAEPFQKLNDDEG